MTSVFNLSPLDLPALVPFALVTIVAVSALMLELLLSEGRREWIGVVVSYGLMLAGLGAVALRNHHGATWSGSLTLDRFGLASVCAVILSSVLTVLCSSRYLRQHQIPEGPFYALLAFAVSGMILMVQAGDLLIFFLGLELMSISFYVLAGLDRSDRRSSEAALKYYIMGAFSSGLMLYGMALTYGAGGSLTLREIGSTLARTSHPALAKVGLAFILSGFFFKIGSVPFHMWAPDVYEGAPVPVGGFLATGVKAAAFAGLARVLYVGFPALASSWGVALWGIAALSVVVGNLGALSQNNIKRLLAYSSIAHAGYMLTAVLAVDPGRHDATGAQALLFYLVAYTAATLGAWTIVAWSGQDGAPIEEIDDFRGLASRHPAVAATLTLFLLALAGIPPTAGFSGKFLIFGAAVRHGYWDLALLGAVASVMSVYYYLRIVVNMYMREGDSAAQFPFKFNLPTAAALVLSVSITVIAGVMPFPLWRLCVAAAQSLF